MYLIKVGENSDIHSWFYNTLFVHEFLNLKLFSLLYGIAVALFYIVLSYKKKIFIKV
jgi:hypothetical protein